MNKIINKKNNKTRGFSLIEIIIYFSLMAVITVFVIGNIISLFKNYNIIKANQSIEYNAITILDKLTRDVRDAKKVIIEDSSFTVPEGIVSLQISSSTDSNVSNEVKFYLENNKIKYMRDGVYFGNLSTNDVNVSSFRIYHINSTTTEAVKIELNLEVTPHLNPNTISKNFYTTIQLRE